MRIINYLVTYMFFRLKNLKEDYKMSLERTDYLKKSWIRIRVLLRKNLLILKKNLNEQEKRRIEGLKSLAIKLEL